MQSAIERKAKFTYADYLTWGNDEKWEIINGVPYNMSPSPGTKHQQISLELSAQIRNFLIESESSCMAFHAPFDVRFPESLLDNNQIIDVVQPDIVVICDTSKVDEKGCHGAPDFIIEILSPSTAYKDYVIKLNLYEKNGVKEYWIIDPTNRIINMYLLDNSGKYERPLIQGDKGTSKVKSVAGLYIDLSLVFKN
jgi:Uma2 family endonuclease